MLAIKNNMMAANAARYLGKSYDALSKSVERLSSGLRINSAKDDAAGMAVRELMRADIAVLEQGQRNAQDGVSMLQTMEGAMATIDSCLVRMKQLAEQSSTGSYSSAQRVIMNNEFQEMAAEIERISTTTQFNNIKMLDNTTDVTIRFGTATDDKIAATGADMTKAGLGIQTGTAGYEAVSGTGAATADTDWLTVGGTVAGSRNVTITFDDGGVNEDSIVLSLSSAHGGDGKYTLNEIAALINAQTQNLGNSKNYDMASVVEGDDTTNGRNPGTYYLKLSSRLNGADGSTIAADTGLGDLTGGWAALTAAGTTLDAAYGGANAGLMGEQNGTGINLLSADAATSALSSVASAIGLKDTARAAFGYKINRLESTGEVLAIQTENLMTAESRISDVDVATEMATLTRNQVLAQAGTSMLAQANSIPQMALTLLR
jgi:flagellin